MAGEVGKKADKATARKKRRRSRGALVAVATLLISSGVLRLGLEAERALAKEQTGIELSESAEQEKQLCETPEDLRATLEMFREREDRLDAREAQIKDRMQALTVADREISVRMEELRNAEADLRELLTIADEAAEGDLARLTAVYEAMKPKDAAALFEEMAPEFAAGFLGRMRPEAAAGIMTGLSPDAAYTISVVLAGRNARAPKE